ncbi:EutN/CcmL family microcompartment protein [Clostridiisalibacter paucivorans]|uniref:EutN/CcmL family microcompartment protein n=1 Tax=Clostridiisalibacter paucivorans TaxID=408753 RepID=UPI00047AA8DB|nr:EutN/CcmL family microcompartment protein [Clostridiisalibacter paucivorans]
MIVGKVVGNIWATRKDEALNGLKFLVVKPLDYSSGKDLPTVVAADTIGAGIGETVLIVNGSSARMALGRKDIPIDAIIVGIIDVVDVEED